jgi:hypothetical protein
MHAFGRGEGFVQSSITFRPRQYPRLTTAAVSGGAFAYLRLRDATNGPYSTSARGRMLTGSHWRLKTQRPSLPVRRPPYDAVCSSLFATAALFEAIRQGRRFSTWPAALLLLIQPRRREAADRVQGDRGKARVTERAMLPPPIRRCSENTPAVN